jgi:hypothetical protein
MPIIISILLLTVLPPLLLAFAWWITPEPILDMFSMLAMMLVMVLMFKIITPMLTPPKETKRVERRAE